MWNENNRIFYDYVSKNDLSTMTIQVPKLHQLQLFHSTQKTIVNVAGKLSFSSIGFEVLLDFNEWFRAKTMLLMMTYTWHIPWKL